MNDSTLISIVTPTYNSELCISKTIASVINQTYKNWEMLIVDDGSTDKSIEIIKKRAINEPRIKFFQRISEPKGANTCRNLGLEKASGSYVIFLDSDDELLPECLANRFTTIQSQPNIDFAIFPMGYKNDKGSITKRRNKNPINPIEYFLALNNIWQITSPIWKVDFLRKIGGFNLRYSRLQDVELSLRALLNSNYYKLFLDYNYDSIYNANVKNYNRVLWIKAYKNVEQFIPDSLELLRESNCVKHYKNYLNRSVWNYYLYWWKSHSKELPELKLFSTANIINEFDKVIFRLLIKANQHDLFTTNLFHKIILYLIRLSKKIRSPKFT